MPPKKSQHRIRKFQNPAGIITLCIVCEYAITGRILTGGLGTGEIGMKIDVLKMLLSICEFLDFSRFEIRQMQIAFSGTRKQVVDGNDAQSDLRDAVRTVLRFRGMTAIADIGLDQKKR